MIRIITSNSHDLSYPFQLSFDDCPTTDSSHGPDLTFRPVFKKFDIAISKPECCRYKCKTLIHVEFARIVGDDRSRGDFEFISTRQQY